MAGLVNYGSDVIYRRSANDWIEEVSDADGGLYTAKYAYLGRGWILLRIYKTGRPKLLAERTYQYLDRAKLLWLKNVIIYDAAEDELIHDGGVNLPPTCLDYALANLP